MKLGNLKFEKHLTDGKVKITNPVTGHYEVFTQQLVNDCVEFNGEKKTLAVILGIIERVR